VNLDELVDRLLTAAADDAALAEFEALPPDRQRCASNRMRERIGRLMRTQLVDAIPAADGFVRVAERVPSLRGLAHRCRGNALHFNARSPEARVELERSIEEFERIGEVREAATARRNLVDVLMLLGDSPAALAAADAAREVLISLPDTEDDLARLEINVGNVHLRMDEYPAARQHYERALASFQTLDNRLGIGITSFNLGIVDMNANDVEGSEHNLKAAREAFVAAGMDVHVADCDYNLAYLLSRRGRWSDAIRGLEEARANYLRIGKPSGPPLCDLDLAEIYLRLDARRNAVEYATRAAEGFQELGLRYEAARCAVLAGLALLKLGSPNDALDRLQHAGEAFLALGNQAAAAAVDVQRGAIEIAEGAPHQARARLKSAYAVLDRRQLRFLTDLAGVTLSRAQLACGDVAGARTLLEALLARGDENAVFDQLLRADALSLLATVRRDEGDVNGAMDALRGAVDATEHSYGEIPQSDLRVAFFRDRHLAYVELVWDLAESGRPQDRADALRLLEKSRGRSLREERLGTQQQSEEYLRARARLDWLLARQIDGELGTESDGHPLRVGAPGDVQIREAQTAVMRASARLRSDARPVVDLPTEVLEAARGDDIVVFYVIGPRGVRAMLLDQGGVSDVPLQVDGDEIARLRDRVWFHADKLRLGGDYVRARRGVIETSLERVFDQLGRVLVAPLADRLEGRGVVMVPFGDLHDLPFHALRVDGRPLFELAEVSHALSASCLAVARGRKSHGSGRFACGVVSGGLGAIESEMAQLAAVHPNLRTLTADDLVTGLERCDLGGGLLHLAAHGQYQRQLPAFSGLALGERSLLAHDITRLGMPFDLVVLSGCETGRRRRIPGEEFSGLTRALHVGGAHASIGSLWAVDDEGTAEYMAALHARLAAGEGLRAAVAQTQRELRSLGRPATTWAAFSAFGNPDLRLPR